MYLRWEKSPTQEETELLLCAETSEIFGTVRKNPHGEGFIASISNGGPQICYTAIVAKHRVECLAREHGHYIVL